MSSRDLLFRVVAVPVVVAALIIVSWVAVQIMDPFIANMDFSSATALGWGDGKTVYEFLSYALVGLMLVSILWLWFAPIRDDLRQDIDTPRGPF